LTAGADGSIFTPASYVVRFHGKERDTGNVIMV
jgi:hypothetical protein